MHLLLYIQVKTAENIRFGNPLSALTKTRPELLLLDADNHSEALVIHHQLQMIQKAESIILVLDVQEEVSLGKVIRLLEKLLRQKTTQLSVFLHGQNKVIENMLKVTKVQFEPIQDEKGLYSSVTEVVQGL